MPVAIQSCPTAGDAALTAGARAVARCVSLGVAPYSDSARGLFRGWLSPGHRATVRQVGEWMEGAGMQVRLDPLGTLIGRYEGAQPGAPALLLGSHLDSVRDAGYYDGPLGVMLAIECVAALHAQDRRLPFALEVLGFGDEEGSRFPASMFGSRAVAGTLAPTALEAICDSEGISVPQALAAWGLDAARLGEAARRPHEVIGYLETHIEQGPVLEAAALPVGVVTGIAAQLRLQVRVHGRAGHAGTCPMHLRQDALAAAAEGVLAAEAVARAGSDDLVATVGRLALRPGATNVVPGWVEFSLDVRAASADVRDAAATQIQQRLQAIADARGVGVEVQTVQALPASPCAPALVAQVEAAVRAQGLPVRRLVSGAGHDAMVMSALCPTAMLFVRCAGGISHHPDEHVDPADAEVALAVMRHFIDHLGASLVT
ncbi:allantoate amidohydrolase [Xanthomonas maliensis]|uniref:allantoate amidohydrolase n=1 Tax=Xanthomonas maliensis TaxID=1321368 RepID=UPI0003A45457|nr:allantoate amidohydrolase [Xanthomonas maliensis]KAB7769709.1 allantoate amidohydrolase [Xanthomonas maliensis]